MAAPVPSWSTRRADSSPPPELTVTQRVSHATSIRAARTSAPLFNTATSSFMGPPPSRVRSRLQRKRRGQDFFSGDRESDGDGSDEPVVRGTRGRRKGSPGPRYGRRQRAVLRGETLSPQA